MCILILEFRDLDLHSWLDVGSYAVEVHDILSAYAWELLGYEIE